MYRVLITLQTFMLINLFAVSTVCAHDEAVYYDRIHLSASATAQLANDTMVVTVFAEEEGSKAQELSSLVNKKIHWGLELVKQYPDIKRQTNSYTTHPVYQNNKIKGWRVRQSLLLESKDMALMSEVLGQLQNKLALGSMQFSISPESRDAQDKILIDKALESFEKRSQQVVVKLRRKNYKIVDINISTSGSRPKRAQYEMRAMSMASEPAVSAGEQTVSVTVSGKIELE